MSLSVPPQTGPLAIVLGGTGFVGRELARNWPSQLRRPVFLVHRSRPAWLETADIDLRTVDLGDPESTAAGLENGTVLVNLMRPDGTGWYPDALRRLVPVFRRSSVRRCVHASSIDVYSGCADPLIDESTPVSPLSPYEREHCAAEGILTETFPETAILRLGAVFGVGGRNVVSLAEEMKSAPDWKLVLRRALYGKRRMHLVSVEAVCRALVAFSLFPGGLSAPTVALVTQDDDPANNFAFVQDTLARYFGRRPLDRVPALPEAFLKAALRARRIPTGSVGRRFSGRRAAEFGTRLDGFEAALQAYALHLSRDDGKEAS